MHRLHGRLISFAWILNYLLAAQVKNFDYDSPLVPSEKDDLVVECVWQFDSLNLAEVVTHLQWVPNSEKVVTGHKHGILRLYESIDSDVDDYVELIDMRVDVDSEGDHGLLSFHFHPQFESGYEKAYIMYTGNPKDVSILPNNDIVAPLRDEGWGMGPTGGYEWPYDLCTYLGDNNEDGKICEKQYYIDRVAVNLEADPPTMVKELTLFIGACGSSSTHGPGTILEINGDLIFSMGDGSQYDLFDAGFELLDACFEPDGGADQGFFRAQREEFANGKVIRIPADLLNSDVPLSLEQLNIVCKGLRQPYRIFYEESKDKLYIGDVGYGDWGTSERIFVAPDISSFDSENDISFNLGWPCLEGMYDTAADALAGNFNPFNAPSEQLRYEYLDSNGLTTCDGVKDAVDAYVGGYTAPDTADLGWQPPIFEYRNDILDPDYPTYCGTTNAAITSVFVYDGDSIPELYRGKLMFADHVKQCLWYFDNDDDGNPDMSSPPHIILSNANIIDMQLGFDGAIYMLDYVNARVFRMYQYGKGPLAGTDTPPPTLAPTPAPFAVPENIVTSQQCFDPKGMPELVWTRNNDGSYSGDLVLGVVIMSSDKGTARTRGWNGMIPGPLIRMKACSIYHLNVYNDLYGWPEGSDGDGALNGVKDPIVTNLHLHGLHISGESPGDNVFIEIEPGNMYPYVYTIPCDHSGGTHFYHTHHHGSTALQTGAGAAGMLIIESSAREASGMPMDIQTMPEQFIVIQEFIPATTARIASQCGDRVYDTDIVDPFILVNGCDSIDITVEAGQWTRFHILNVAEQYNRLLSVIADNGAMECDIGLLSKDGVWLAEVPRKLEDNQMFFSISSRIDIAVRCSEVSSVHQLTYLQLGVAGVESADYIGTITVVSSYRNVAEDLTVWMPCRPAYLIDIETLPEESFLVPWTLEVRDGLNTLVFTGVDNYMAEIEINMAQLWIISGTELHPFHVHINHMQFGSDLSSENQWTELPNWNVAGDWVDSLSAPGAAQLYIRPERFTGHMVMHCHIAEHGDNGILGIINITGDGDAGVGSPEVTDYGTCPVELPLSTPYNGNPSQIPGIVEAEYFDEGGEGIGYHNINIDRNAGPVMRWDEAVEIDGMDTVTWVGYIRDGEWLKYTVHVIEAAFYTVGLMAASTGPSEGMQWSLWLDVARGCPAASKGTGQLLRISDPDYVGTGSYVEFGQYFAEDPVYLPIGKHTLTICFEGADAALNLDSYSFAICGTTVDDCIARKRQLREQNLNTQKVYRILDDGKVIAM